MEPDLQMSSNRSSSGHSPQRGDRISPVQSPSHDERMRKGYSPQRSERVIEVPRIIRQERVHRRPVEQIVEVPVPQMVEEIREVPTLIHKARALQSSVEQVVEIPVPQVVEEVVEIPKIVVRERIRQRSVEKISDIPVPQVVEERVEKPVVVHQSRICHRMVDYCVDVPVPQVVEVRTTSRSPSPLSDRLATSSRSVNNVVQEEVVEVPRLIVLERVKQRTVERFVDVFVPHIVEEVEEITTPVTLRNVARNVVPYTVDVPVPEIVEEVVEVTKEVAHEKVRLHSVEKVVDVPIPQLVEEVVQVPVKQVVERVQQRVVEVPAVMQIEDRGFPWLRDEVARLGRHPHPQGEKPKVTLKTVQRRVPSSPTHEVFATDSPERTRNQTVDVPQIHWVDRVVDVPVIKQIEVPMIQKVEKLVEVPQIHWVDQKMEVPRIKEVPVPKIQKMQTKQEVLQMEWVEKVVDVPVIKQRPVPVIQKVQSIVEVPRLEFVDDFLDMPVLKQRQVPLVQRVQRTVEVETFEALGCSQASNSSTATRVPLIQKVNEPMDRNLSTSRGSSPEMRITSARATKVRKIVEVPKIQWVEKVVDVPVVKQRQVPFVQKVKKIFSKPQVEWQTEVVDCPELTLQHVPSVQVVKKTIEVPQVMLVDKVVEAPTIKVREVPSVRSVEKTVEVPQIEFVDKIVDVPVLKDISTSSSQEEHVRGRQLLPSLKEASRSDGQEEHAVRGRQISPQRFYTSPATPTRFFSDSRQGPPRSPSSILRSPPRTPVSLCRDAMVARPFPSSPVAGSRSITPQRTMAPPRALTPQRESSLQGGQEIQRTPDVEHTDLAQVTLSSPDAIGTQYRVPPAYFQKGVVDAPASQPSADVNVSSSMAKDNDSVPTGSLEAPPSLTTDDDCGDEGSWEGGIKPTRLSRGWLGGSSMQDVLSSVQLEEESIGPRSDSHRSEPEAEDGHTHVEATVHSAVVNARDYDMFSARLLTTYTNDFELLDGNAPAAWGPDAANDNQSTCMFEATPRLMQDAEAAGFQASELQNSRGLWGNGDRSKIASLALQEHNSNSDLGAYMWQPEAENLQLPLETITEAHSAVVPTGDGDMFSARLLTTYITDLAAAECFSRPPWEEHRDDAGSSNALERQLSGSSFDPSRRLSGSSFSCDAEDDIARDVNNIKEFAVGSRVRAQFMDVASNRITNTRYPGCIVSRNDDGTYRINYDDGTYWNSVPQTCMELESQWE